jgi:hypothetical protein
VPRQGLNTVLPRFHSHSLKTIKKRIYGPIDCKGRPFFMITTPTSNGNDFRPVKIEQSLPPPLMTIDKHQIAPRTVSLVPRKCHAGKRQHFSLFFSLALLLADNAVYRSPYTVPIATMRFVLLPSPHVLHLSPSRHAQIDQLQSSTSCQH